MTSHTEEKSDIVETECISMSFRQATSNAGSQLLLKDKHDRTDSVRTDIDSGTESTAGIKNDNVVRLLTLGTNSNTGGRLVSVIPKCQILKNLAIISSSFFLVFTSFHSMMNLQSSMNKEEGVGTFSLVCTNIAFVFSAMFLSSVSMDRFGKKLTMCIAMFMYVIFMAANLYPVWGIMIPGALICGLAAGPLWASQSAFLSQLSRCYAQTTKTEPGESLSYFFGIFYMCVNASKISGNLLASIVLKQDERSNRSMTREEIEDCVANKQGAVDNATTLERPDNITIYAICGTWIGVAIVGIIVLAFLTPIPDDKDTSTDRKKKPIYNKFLATVRHFWNSRLQKLMMPLSLYYGLSTGFLSADFTKSLVGCTFGIHTVGDFMLCHGVCSTIMAALSGRLPKLFGRLPFFTISFLFYAGVQVTLVVWIPGPEHIYLFFIFAGMWGAADAILKTQVLAMYGYLFADNKEAAFGNYFLSEATGFIISYAYSNFASTNVKLYILLGVLAYTATSYYTLEYLIRKDNTRQDVDNASKAET